MKKLLIVLLLAATSAWAAERTQIFVKTLKGKTPATSLIFAASKLDSRLGEVSMENDKFLVLGFMSDSAAVPTDSARVIPLKEMLPGTEILIIRPAKEKPPK